jgi:nucleotide-binding universal stress UspA family protein
MYQKILVPFDGSPPSEHGLREAIRLASELRAALTILNVVDDFQVLQTAGVEGGLYTPDMIALLNAGSKELIDHAVALAGSMGVDAQGISVEVAGGPCSDEIISQAGKLGADLIVMGTHGRRGLGRAILGSDAERVVRTADVPVLLVRGAGTPATAVAAAPVRNAVAAH